MMIVDNLSIMTPAFIAGVMISLIHVKFGLKIIEKGIIFIDLAIAQIAGLGIVTANLFFEHLNFIEMQFFALLFALIGSMIFYLVDTHSEKDLESVIGISFVFSSALMILILSSNPHGAEEMKDLLSGQMLFITWQNIIYISSIYCIYFITSLFFQKLHQGILFYIFFPIIITVSVQLIGVYLVFTTLIVPSVLFYKVKNNAYLKAVIFSVISLFTGLMLSLIFDTPTGTTVVVTFILLGILKELKNIPKIFLRKNHN